MELSLLSSEVIVIVALLHGPPHDVGHALETSANDISATTELVHKENATVIMDIEEGDENDDALFQIA